MSQNHPAACPLPFPPASPHKRRRFLKDPVLKVRLRWRRLSTCYLSDCCFYFFWAFVFSNTSMHNIPAARLFTYFYSDWWVNDLLGTATDIPECRTVENMHQKAKKKSAGSWKDFKFGCVLQINAVPACLSRWRCGRLRIRNHEVAPWCWSVGFANCSPVLVICLFFSWDYDKAVNAVLKGVCFVVGIYFFKWILSVGWGAIHRDSAAFMLCL